MFEKVFYIQMKRTRYWYPETERDQGKTHQSVKDGQIELRQQANRKHRKILKRHNGEGSETYR